MRSGLPTSRREAADPHALQLPGDEPLGAGGYGIVFLASQRKTGAKVAVKAARIESDPRSAVCFHRETNLCSRHHPHIEQLLERGSDLSLVEQQQRAPADDRPRAAVELPVGQPSPPCRPACRRPLLVERRRRELRMGGYSFSHPAVARRWMVDSQLEGDDVANV